jgi:hypothetical protein
LRKNWLKDQRSEEHSISNSGTPTSLVCIPLATIHAKTASRSTSSAAVNDFTRAMLYGRGAPIPRVSRRAIIVESVGSSSCIGIEDALLETSP